jgi:hypothetical protein
MTEFNLLNINSLWILYINMYVKPHITDATINKIDKAKAYNKKEKEDCRHIIPPRSCYILYTRNTIQFVNISTNLYITYFQNMI